MKMNWLLLLLLPGIASAFQTSDACAKADTQLDLTSCAGSKLRVAEVDLKNFVARYSGRLEPAQAKSLNTAEEKWLDYRDSYCLFESSGVLGGSAYPMVLARCKATLTTQHRRKLERLSLCKEGDYSCPVW